MKRNYYLKNYVGIYKVTNNLSGLCYVGQSVRICTRWQEHTSSKKSLLGAAIHSDGIENFSFEVLEECKKEELNERERFWMEHFDCFHPQGYNLSRGTSGGHMRTAQERQKLSEAHKTRAPHSDETRQKMSESNKGLKRSDETRQKMSEAAKGRKLSPETLQKMSESNKGLKRSDETRQKNSEAQKRRHEMRRLRGVAAGADTDHREKGQELSEPRQPPATTSSALLTSESN